MSEEIVRLLVKEAGDVRDRENQTYLKTLREAKDQLVDGVKKSNSLLDAAKMICEHTEKATVDGNFYTDIHCVACNKHLERV